MEVKEDPFTSRFCRSSRALKQYQNETRSALNVTAVPPPRETNLILSIGSQSLVGAESKPEYNHVYAQELCIKPETGLGLLIAT